jgi:hypothetical protein
VPLQKFALRTTARQRHDQNGQPMSASRRITDSTRTSSRVRKVPMELPKCSVASGASPCPLRHDNYGLPASSKRAAAMLVIAPSMIGTNVPLRKESTGQVSRPQSGLMR